MRGVSYGEKKLCKAEQLNKLFLSITFLHFLIVEKISGAQFEVDFTFIIYSVLDDIYSFYSVIY